MLNNTTKMLANDFISQYPNPCRAVSGTTSKFVILSVYDNRDGEVTSNLSLQWLDIIESHLFLYQENLWSVLQAFCLHGTDVPASSS